MTARGIRLERSVRQESSDPKLVREYLRPLPTDEGRLPKLGRGKGHASTEPDVVELEESIIICQYLGSPCNAYHGANPAFWVQLYSDDESRWLDPDEFTATYDPAESTFTLSTPAGLFMPYFWIDTDGDGVPYRPGDLLWWNLRVLPSNGQIWCGRLVELTAPVSTYSTYQYGSCTRDGLTFSEGPISVAWQGFPEPEILDYAVTWVDQRECSTGVRQYIEGAPLDPTSTSGIAQLPAASSVAFGVDLLGGSWIYGEPIYLGLGYTNVIVVPPLDDPSRYNGFHRLPDGTYLVQGVRARTEGCTYQIDPNSATYEAGGGAGTVSVATAFGCPWTAASNAGWISVTSGASGSGSGTVHYSVAANSSPNQRTGTITTAALTFTITQSGTSSCTYSISPTSRSFDENGGNGSVSVSTDAGCAWTAASHNAWLQITSGASGVGSGTVNYRVDVNTGGARTGTMTIADHTFTVTQSAGGGVGGSFPHKPGLVGRWPYGPAYAVTVSGEYTYYGSGTALMIADLSNPEARQLVGDVALPGVIHDIAISDGYAYVASGSDSLRVGIDGVGGLRVVDVRNPSAPIEVGFIGVSPAPHGILYECVAVSGGYAYAGEWRGLRVIDVHDPSAPRAVQLIETESYPRDVVAQDGYVYFVDFRGFHVVEAKTPTTVAHEVGFLELQFADRGVAVSDGYAYAIGSAGLVVIDVRNAAAPIVVGSVGIPNHEGSGVAVADGYAYVAAGSRGLRVIDVRNPSAPVEVGFFDPSELNFPYFYHVAELGGVATVVGSDGLHVIDVQNPSAPAEAGYLETPGGNIAVATTAGHAYILEQNPPAIRVINVETPSTPTEVGHLSLGDDVSPTSIAISGSYAFTVDSRGRLLVIDVHDPSEPVNVGSVEIPGATDVAASGRYAFVTYYDYNSPPGGLRVIDAGAPSAPAEIGSVQLPGHPWAVAVSDGYAYVAAVDGGFRVVDVRTPTTPSQVGGVGGNVWDVAVSGVHAYVAEEAGNLRVIDVSAPSAPVRGGAFHQPFGWGPLVASADYAYWWVPLPYVGTTGFWVVDGRDLESPVEVGYLEMPGDRGWGTVSSDGYVIVAEGSAGLSIFWECGQGYETLIPAAALAAGAQGAFFQTDVEINNSGSESAEVAFAWLPRAGDNTHPLISEPYVLRSGESRRFENVLSEALGLVPDSAGALRIVSSSDSVIGMSRTYNIPGDKAAGTFGQEIPAVRMNEMISGTERRRIIFMSEDSDSRANVGCVNETSAPLRINIGVYDDTGAQLEVKTMDLGPYGNNQINRIFRDYQPMNGYVDVWADSDEAAYFCYGSMLDNETSDPTTILPQEPSDAFTFIPAAALSAGLEGAFFQTDIDLNNAGPTDVTYELLWLPRGADNSEPIYSDTFSLAPGAGVRYGNVLGEVFGLEPDKAGALALDASGTDLLAMSRTYNVPGAKIAGTFGQGMPGIPADRMIQSGERKRIMFMNETDEMRSNVGCQNGSDQPVRVFIELFNSEGEALESRTMDLPPLSNNQITRIFRNHAPISASYVDIWTEGPGVSIYCYGSVLDNGTSDPTTVLPQ